MKITFYAILFCVTQYKSSPCKKVCVLGWMVVLPDDPAQPNIFQLNDPDKGKSDSLRDSFSAFIMTVFTKGLV